MTASTRKTGFILELVPEAPATAEMRPEPADAIARLAYEPGQTLAQAVYLSGRFQPPVLCSGLSRCGRCRMRITGACPPASPADETLFSTDELAAGWRLACRHLPAPGMRVELPSSVRPFSEDYLAAQASCEEKTVFRPRAVERHALAVDLGTTSLQWRQIAVAGPEDPARARVVWEGGAVNPQMGAGSDVVARLAVASTAPGSGRLHALTLGSLRGLAVRARELARGNGKGELEALCLAANPAMTCIALGLDTAGLATAPYRLAYTGGDWRELPGLPPVWVPPQLSPFVGGDISAGYAFLALNPAGPPPRYPFLLADLGTNGEFLLALGPSEAWTASVALGPALEGAGLSRGTEARPGAVSEFSLSPKGLEARCLPYPDPACAASEPPGITGTGYLSLLRILLTSETLDREGRFRQSDGPFRRFFDFSRDPASEEPCLALPLGLSLLAGDVEELLKVKAAFSLGLRRLLAHTGLESQDLAEAYVAGALGLHVDKNALEELGFLPEGMASRVRAVGNSSLAGAEVLLRSAESRQALVQWAGKTRNLDLAADPHFLRGFAAHMRFRW